MLVFAADTAPAGGAAFSEIAAATAGAGIITAVLVFIGFAHRNGRISWLRKLGDYFAARSGMPAWAAIPSGLAAISLIGALFGMLWDISLHIDDGRDPGPLANPAHYFILAGLFGTFTSGFLSIVLAEGNTSKAAIRLAPNWHVPLGGVLLTAAGGFALFGFPLDDVWHRLFGQDVTLWGPTHLMLIGGAGLSLIGIQTLLVEARSDEAAGAGGPAPSAGGSAATPLTRLLDFFYAQRAAFACGGLLLGMSVFQAEYDFGVEQFRMVFHPVLIAFAASLALVCARIYGGPGTAMKGAVFFLVIRGTMALIVGPLLGEATPHFPLYLVEAAVVEGAALAFAPTKRPYLFATASGVLIATVGFAAEYGWSQIWMPIEWPSRIVGEALIVVPVTAVAAALIGAFVGSALRAPVDGSRVRLPHPAFALASVLAICVVVWHGLDTTPQPGVRAQVALQELSPAPDRTVQATVRVTPASAAEDADWVNITSWQGKDKLVVDKLRPLGGGVYRSTEPIPVAGTWKTLVRIHKGDSLLGVPIYLPRDTAIPAAEVPARASFERPFVADRTILQREAKGGVSAATWNIAYAIIGVIFAALIALMGWSMMRLARSADGEPSPPRRRSEPVAPPRPAAV
jgi:hypothetical protein